MLGVSQQTTLTAIACGLLAKHVVGSGEVTRASDGTVTAGPDYALLVPTSESCSCTVTEYYDESNSCSCTVTEYYDESSSATATPWITTTALTTTATPLITTTSLTTTATRPTPPPGSTTLYYTGSDYSFYVPQRVTELSVAVHGGSGTGWNSGAQSGRGGLATGQFPVVASELLTVMCGATGVGYGGGGSGGDSCGGACGGRQGSNGGGMSAIWRGVAYGVPIIIAGGGGGEAYGINGGTGGGLVGNSSGESTGGSQEKGGSGGNPGQRWTGGAGVSGRTGAINGGGGGGGGFYGGGGGIAGSDSPSGGGGGSGYLDSTVINGSLVNGGAEERECRVVIRWGY